MQIYRRKDDGTFWCEVGISVSGRRMKQCKADGGMLEEPQYANYSEKTFAREFEECVERRTPSAPVEFQVGDVVILKSGGLQMVVSSLSQALRADKEFTKLTQEELRQLRDEFETMMNRPLQLLPKADVVMCTWMDTAGVIRSQGFDVRLLARVDDQQLQPVPLEAR